MNLRIHRLAAAEIDREVDDYESRQAGLGTELEDEIETVSEGCNQKYESVYAAR